MATTYEAIQTTTLGSAAPSITFSSIAASWTDLRVVFVGKAGSGTYANFRVTFNGDTSALYSKTALTGDGSSASSSRQLNATFIDIAGFNLDITNSSMHTIDLFSYAGSTNKTCLFTHSMDYNGAGGVERDVGLYRSTAAITSITMTTSANTYAIGTTATLYGIKAA